MKKLKKETLEKLAALGTNSLMVFDMHMENRKPTFVWNDETGAYDPFTKNSKPYQLVQHESPALTERLEQVGAESIASQHEAALQRGSFIS